MAADVASKLGFYLVYVFIFSIGLMFAIGFSSIEGKFIIKNQNVETSVVIDAIVKCFSEERRFGEIDESNFIDSTSLKDCAGTRNSFDIKLIKTDGQNKRVKFGELGIVQADTRYVLVDRRPARLEVSYTKNGA